MNRRGYQVVVTRDDGAWLAEVPELVGASTFVRTLPALDRSVREVIVLADDLPDEAIGELTLDDEYRTGDPSIDKRSAQVRALRSRAEELSARGGRHRGGGTRTRRACRRCGTRRRCSA